MEEKGGRSGVPCLPVGIMVCTADARSRLCDSSASENVSEIFGAVQHSAASFGNDMTVLVHRCQVVEEWR